MNTFIVHEREWLETRFKTLDLAQRLHIPEHADLIAAKDLGDNGLPILIQNHAPKVAILKDLKLQLAQPYQIVNPTTLWVSHITFGSTVVALDLDEDVEETYAIVGSFAATHLGYQNSFGPKFLSYRAPLSRALVGKSEGDELEVHCGSHTRRLEIISVSHQEVGAVEEALRAEERLLGQLVARSRD